MRLRIPRLDAAQVLVAGDVMLDRYWYGDTARISPEAPVPVVRFTGSEDRLGGAANVAFNVVSLGGSASVVGVTGDDTEADALGAALAAVAIEGDFERLPGLPTITKLRVVSRHQQLIRLDFENGFHSLQTERLLARFRPRLGAANVVVLSDYAKGALRDIQPFIEAARAAGLPVLLDPKSRDFDAYRGATVLTPNRAEFETVAGPCVDERELERRARDLVASLDLEGLLITRGEEGMSLFQRGAAPLHLPTRAQEVFDVTGAGDTVIAGVAAGLGGGMTLADATSLANLAAGVVVGKLGTATATVSEVRLALFQQEELWRGVVDEPTLAQSVQDARGRGERIVMTNGCFDILHAGHVAYLEQARGLGDRLIVAVNDDDSVRRLKGATRPINSVEHRMEVLAALAAVDWVLPFGEDTPERLVCAIEPDVLVKGGDYRPEQIAGAGCVTRNGGEVVVLDFIPGQSTSHIVERIVGSERR
jgi:D-beta-D-heptose 7-phosphate kinase/D-beta-D-heptose 1-phosphate adenosyltransferase